MKNLDGVQILIIVVCVLLVISAVLSCVAFVENAAEFRAQCLKVDGVTVHNGKFYECLKK